IKAASFPCGLSPAARIHGRHYGLKLEVPIEIGGANTRTLRYPAWCKEVLSGAMQQLHKQLRPQALFRYIFSLFTVDDGVTTTARKHSLVIRLQDAQLTVDHVGSGRRTSAQLIQLTD